MPQRLDELLQECTVKITVPDQSGWGTGFFVAPGLILTCAHVVKRSPGQVQVGWQNKTLDAVVERSIPDPYDLALLRVTLEADANLPCVWLDEDVQPRDPLYLFGYPDEGDLQGEPRTFNCDGITGSNVAAILFNLGQVRPGMSGSPLLNQRTGKVCGMVKFTRDRSIDLGGGAISSRVILEQFPQLGQLQQKFHQGDQRWRDCAGEIGFEPYLQAILADDDYQEWQEVYTPTTAEDRRRMPAQDAATVSQRRFSSRLKLRVETVKPDKQGQGKQPDGTPELQEQVEQWDVLAGLRNYAAEHVVLIGKPGSGKSTSLERLLWEEAENALDDPTARIPVLVKLRRCTGTIEGLIRDFLVGHQVAVETAHIEKLLSQGRLLLLLDGLNELPERFRTEIANFRDRYHSTTPMIVSTRDLSVGGTLGIAKTLKMLPLTEPQMREFVRGYLGDEGDRLFQQIQGDRLRKFAETPLLLWMLCRVFAEECIQAAKEKRTPKLPENLGLAFREFTQLYDHGTDKHQAIQEDAPVDSRDQWPRLLRHLAFVMMQGKTLIDPELSIPREEAEDCLTAYLQQAGRANSRECVERWLTDLLKYHLIQPVIQPNFEEHIEFRHQLIQEYYAAEYLLKLLPNLTDDQLKRDYLNYLKWTEPISLMLALVDDEAQALRVVKLAIDDVDLMLGSRLAGEVSPTLQPTTIRYIDALDISIDLKVRCWATSRSEAAILKLLTALEDPDSSIRCREIAAEALGQIGSEAAIPRLLTALNGLSSGVRPVLRDPESGIRCRVVEALGQIGSEDAIDSLLAALEDLDNRVRDEVGDALVKIGSEASIPGLYMAMGNKHSGVRNKAVETLVRICNKADIFDLMTTALLEHPSLQGRSRAAKALEEIGDKAAIPSLLTALENPVYVFYAGSLHVDLDYDDICRSVAATLGKLGSEADVPKLLQAMKNPYPVVRARLAFVLGEIGSEEAIEGLLIALNDSKSIVRENAAWSLGRIGSKVAIAGLLNAREDPEPNVRRRVIEALRIIDNEE